jgi:hypothetical protein
MENQVFKYPDDQPDPLRKISHPNHITPQKATENPDIAKNQWVTTIFPEFHYEGIPEDEPKRVQRAIEYASKSGNIVFSNGPRTPTTPANTPHRIRPPLGPNLHPD